MRKVLATARPSPPRGLRAAGSPRSSAAVEEAALSAAPGRVQLIEEPIAAGDRRRRRLGEPVGRMVNRRRWLAPAR